MKFTSASSFEQKSRAANTRYKDTTKRAVTRASGRKESPLWTPMKPNGSPEGCWLGNWTTDARAGVVVGPSGLADCSGRD